MPKFVLALASCLIIIGCQHATSSLHTSKVAVAAERVSEYLPLLENKRVAVVANQSSRVGDAHLIDVLLSHRVDIKLVFAPEHGFRGSEAAGESVSDFVDAQTGLRVQSLYGKNLKPTSDQLTDVDILLFDIQDVGVRFYTYISTLAYVMESCAENDMELIVLDRPNPNGHYVDGPVLDLSNKSFIGLHPVPIVYGMTIGEYARMINAEGWLAGGLKCKLTVVPMRNYDHMTAYSLPVPPSPNLKSQNAIYLYPSTGLFENTQLSVGRGTIDPFTVVGHPDFKGIYSYSFTPVSSKFAGQECFGIDFVNDPTWGTHGKIPKQIRLDFIIELYRHFPNKSLFFDSYFDKLSGDAKFRTMIQAGKSELEIRHAFQPELEKFKQIRRQYLLYPDFE